MESLAPNVELELVFVANKALISLIQLVVTLTILVPDVDFNCLAFCQVGQQSVDQTFFSGRDTSYVDIELFRWQKGIHLLNDRHGRPFHVSNLIGCAMRR